MRQSTRSTRPTRRRLASLWFLVFLLAPVQVRAEEVPEESSRAPGYRALKASVGLGLVSADDQNGLKVAGSGQGFYGDVEYVLRPDSWFSPRGYAGLNFTRPASDCGPQVTPCDVSARYVFGGVKARALLPIPWVAPFFELGLGLSLGRFSTRSGQLVDVSESGFTYHVPWSLGLAIGEGRQFELAFIYLSHPRQAQTSGALAFGMQFALD